MPSRKHQAPVTTTYLPHLSSILNLDPEGEPNCAGMAVTKGRRCQLRTNAHGRRTALSLLEKGTIDLHAGLCIDDILERIAPHVLCTRWHQNQALDLVAKWKRRVRQFSAPTPTQRSSSRRSSRDPYEGWTIAECLAELRRLQTERAAGSVAASRPPPRAPLRNDPLANGLGSNLSNISSIGTTRRTVQQQSETAIPTLSRRTESTVPTNVQPVRRAVSAPTSSQSPAATRAAPSVISSRRSSIVRHSSPPVSLVSAVRPQEVPRRAVEGNCIICLVSLRRSHGPNVGESLNKRGDRSSNGDDGEKEEEEEDDQEDIDGIEVQKKPEVKTGEEEVEYELCWCKAQCGVNYHKKCMDRWLTAASRPSCPSCRRIWKH